MFRQSGSDTFAHLPLNAWPTHNLASVSFPRSS